MRALQWVYRDPVEQIWVATAARLGIQLQRSREVFASWDGQSTLTIGAPETLDPDDSLAQMILHELCHALIEGPSGWHQVDWGLASQDARREFACLRLQAKLADSVGLRHFFASTTQFRDFYDRLPADPLESEIVDSSDASLAWAREGWHRYQASSWRAEIAAALQATADIAQAVAPFVDSKSLWAVDRVTATDTQIR